MDTTGKALSKRILIVDDEKNIREGLGTAFDLEGYEVSLASDGKEALALIERTAFDLVITDLRMNGVSGDKLLLKVKALFPLLPVIVLTGHGSIDSAVEAMRNGAYDFLTKPVNLDHLMLVASRAIQQKDLYLTHDALLTEVKDLRKDKSLKTMVGKSSALQEVQNTIQKVAPLRTTVLITGENGTGKELVADAIHNLSLRKDAPFIKVNCAALSESLLESELFGHEKGAYTGAVSQERGRFERAQGGTIFLDEIGEINPSVQVKLLRVLQERAFERVGGTQTIKVDIRLIAATNRNLSEEVKSGRFREDLYYRLNVINICVPPLRERKDDLPLLIDHFIKLFSKENGKHITGVSNKARSLLYNFDYPGNIRELGNIIEAASVMATGEVIEAEDLPPRLRGTPSIDAITIPLGLTLKESEKKIILNTLSHCNGNKTLTAKTLALGRATLERKLKLYQKEVTVSKEPLDKDD